MSDRFELLKGFFISFLDFCIKISHISYIINLQAFKNIYEIINNFLRPSDLGDTLNMCCFAIQI